jgi:RNA polymerase sigma-70 factor (ECF subfamily)
MSRTGRNPSDRTARSGGVRAPQHTELEDGALVAGLAIDDPGAATAFVRRFQSKVFGLALAITRDTTSAEDVAQEAFVRAWRSAAIYDASRASVSTWLLTITRNAAIDAVRARRTVPADHEFLDSLLEVTLGGADRTSAAALASVEVAGAMGRLRAMPAPQARAVVLAVLGGCTAEQIGELEGVPLGTAKTRIRTGLRRLRADVGGAG